MEQPPASPPIFLDYLPQMPNISSEVLHHVPNNDLILPYISRMLIEDDIDDELSEDHPALLQVQLPFANIIYSPSYSTNTNNYEGPNKFLHEGYGDESALNSHLSMGTCAMGASLEGLEEANMILRQDNNFRSDELVNQIRDTMNKDHVLEEEVRAVMMINELEKYGNEMLDKMMFHAYEICIKGRELVTIDNTDNGGRNRNRRKIAARKNVVDIRRLLISCAQALAADDNMTTCELLKQIKQHASTTGDANQRLAHCFAIGLEARIMGSGSQLYQLLMLDCPSAVELLKACKLYSEACCFNNVGSIFLAATIIEAMACKGRLHIVDYGTRFGFHLAGLLRLLACKEGCLPEVKITSIARPTRICFPVEKIEKVGCRLTKYAHELGFPSFKFHTIMKRWEDTSTVALHRDADEALVVIDHFSFSFLMEESVFFDDPSPRDIVLNNIKKMRPDVFIQSIMNRLYGTSFLSRFRETLFYYMTLFDMLDANISRDCKSRLVFEKAILKSVFNDISCEGMDLVQRHEKYRHWQTRNERAGLMQLPLKSSIVKAMKDEVAKHYHKDFLICQDDQWLLQGWMGRVLSAHTAWVAIKEACSG